MSTFKNAQMQPDTPHTHTHTHIMKTLSSTSQIADNSSMTWAGHDYKLEQ